MVFDLWQKMTLFNHGFGGTGEITTAKDTVSENFRLSEWYMHHLVSIQEHFWSSLFVWWLWTLKTIMCFPRFAMFLGINFWQFKMWKVWPTFVELQLWLPLATVKETCLIFLLAVKKQHSGQYHQIFSHDMWWQMYIHPQYITHEWWVILHSLSSV